MRQIKENSINSCDFLKFVIAIRDGYCDSSSQHRNT